MSSNDLIVGETLYFSGYVYSETTGKLSSLSSLLYIDLLDENSKSVARTQISLEDGHGSGKLYIPTEFETGNYHVVAYTRWMKNFGDLFHKRITIINPYKTYYPVSNNSKQPKIDFFAEGGHLVSDVKNKVIIRASDHVDNGKVIRGRVIDKSGNTIAQVETDSSGCFGFTFIPKRNESYQLLSESKSGFRFNDMPGTCDECARLLVEKKASNYIIDVKSNIKKDAQYELLICHKQDTIKRFLAGSNSETLIAKNDLPKGLITVHLILNDVEYCNRIFWNGNLDFGVSKGDVKSYTQLENVSTTVFVDKPANVSISVSKVYTSTNSEINIISYEELDAQLETPVTRILGNSPSDQVLDNLLICSKLQPTKPLPKTVTLLPEYRYGIVQGNLLNVEDDRPISNEVIGVSLLGINDNISFTQTDSMGRFILMYDYNIPHSLGSITTINEMAGSNKIVLENPFYDKYPQFTNTIIQLDSSKVHQIVKRSIANQVQNAYYLSDSTKNTQDKYEVLSGSRSYVLSNYTRFQTIRDTFIEIIPEVGVSKNEQKFDFRMRMEGVDFNDKQTAPTLLLLDGIFVSAKDILELSPYTVERIDVLNRRYYFGGIFFNGVISVHTFKKDASKNISNGEQVRFTETQNGSFFGFKVNQTLDRIPHYEYLLLWQPNVEHTGGELKINFTTSEVTGLFQIKVEGIDVNGVPVSKTKYFYVEPVKN